MVYHDCHFPILKRALETRDREFVTASNMYKSNGANFEEAKRMIRNARVQYREAVEDYYQPGVDISPSSGRVRGTVMPIPLGELR